jgi:hypothetical protein
MASRLPDSPISFGGFPVPAPDLIAAGVVDRVAADLRWCRDNRRGTNCDSFAERRFFRDHPTEDRRSWNSILNHARNSIDYGNRANQSRADTVIRGTPGQSPADTQYGGGNTGPIRYRYGVQVTINATSPDGRTQQFPITVFVNSRGPLSVGEVRDQANREAIRQAPAFLDGSERLAGSDTEITADTRIVSAHRDRN